MVPARPAPGGTTDHSGTRTTCPAPAPGAAKHDDLQVCVVGGIDHDERAAGDPGQDLGDPVGSAAPDVVQRDAVDLVRGDRAVALLGDEVPQVGRGVAEGGVLGEFGVADWNGFAGHVGPMNVTGGEPAGLEVGGISSTPSNPVPMTRRRAASMARISAMTWPRRVESLRLTTSMGPPRPARA